jgi:hypothetical protein
MITIKRGIIKLFFSKINSKSVFLPKIFLARRLPMKIFGKNMIFQTGILPKNNFIKKRGWMRE